MKPFHSIRAKLLIFGLCISLIPIAIISTIDYFNARIIVKKQTLEWLTAVAESREIHVLEFMNGKKERATDFASDGLIRDSLEKINRGESLEHDTAIALNRYLLQHKKSLDPSIEGIEIVDLEGTVVISDHEVSIGQNIRDIERLTPGEDLAYMRVVDKNYTETCIGSPHHSKLLNIDSISAAAPITSMENGEPLGVIINEYNLKLLNEITTNREGMSETGEVYLVNSDGLMITESRFIENAILKQVVDTEPVRRIARGGGEMRGIYPDYRGVPIVGASMYLPEYGWTLLAEIDKAEAFAPIRKLGIVAMIVCLVSAATVIAIGIIFAFSTSRPIRKLTDATRRFAGGDLKSRVKITRKDEIGELAGSFNTMARELAREITERKLTEEQLRKLTHAIEQSHSTVLITDTKGNIEYVNLRFIKLTGYTKEEALGKTPGMLKSGKTPPKTYKRLWETITSGKEWRGEFCNKKKNGELYWESASISPVRNAEGVITHFIAIKEDITERKEMEEEIAKRSAELAAANVRLKELDKLKSMFIASMSHELRTPLNSIIGFTGLVLRGIGGEINEQQKDNLSRVKRSAKHLLSLINDVIDISKVEAGRIEVFVEEFTLDEVVKEAVESVQPQINEKGLTLEVSIPPGVRLKTDRKRLLQCILNYLSNAVKFTEAGTISIAAQEINGEVEITVTDAGIGIAKEDLPKLFNAFVRLDSAVRTKILGTGLGLYLTGKLAREVLGGTVAAWSELGKGSTFTLRVPKELKQKQA